MSAARKIAQFPPEDTDPRHIAIMEAWARRIVTEVAAEMADRVVAEVGAVFLAAKNQNYDSARSMDARMDAIEAAFAKATKPRKGTKK